MNLLDIAHRAAVPEPWAEGEKIPWDDTEFSTRMLREHLSQEHDAASRRREIIERHVAWIHNEILDDRPSRVLDLACGPGLYTARLASLGHQCVGIDFAPASIAYARKRSETHGLSCEYMQGDIRKIEYGSGYDLAMLIFGEFNVFRREDALKILEKARAALVAGGLLLIEAHTFDAVRAAGAQPATWKALRYGLFSDRPHLRLDESFWNEEQCVATERYFIIDAGTAAVTRYAQSIQAYTTDEYQELLRQAGYTVHRAYGSLGDDGATGDFFVLLAKLA